MSDKIERALMIVDALLTGDGRIFNNENPNRPNNTISDEHLQYLHVLKDILREEDEDAINNNN